MISSYPDILNGKEFNLLLALLNSDFCKYNLCSSKLSAFQPIFFASRSGGLSISFSAHRGGSPEADRKSKDLRESALININWNQFMRYASSHELMPFAFYKLKHCKDKMPQAVQDRLKSSYHYNLSCNIKLWQEFLNVVDGFKDGDITMVPIKGMDLLLRFYPGYYWRRLADIDVLIKKKELDKTCRVLARLGYKKQLFGFKETYWRKKQCHIAFTKGSILLEVHWSFDFKRKHRILLPHLWKRIKQIDIENRKINILSPEDALFGFALHNRRMGRILGLKQVFDLAKIINETSNFDWNYVLKEADQAKIQTTLYFSLAQAKCFTVARIPSVILKKLSPGYWKKKFIHRLILKNTFKKLTYSQNKKIYLKAHFLLYDSFWESVSYILNIPYEQFCKYYGLKPYTKKSNFIYRLRLAFIFFRLLFSNFKRLEET